MNLKQLMFLKSVSGGGSSATEVTVTGTSLSFIPGLQTKIKEFTINFN